MIFVSDLKIVHVMRAILVEELFEPTIRIVDDYDVIVRRRSSTRIR